MNTVKCPSCGKDVEISEALKHQMSEEIRREVMDSQKEDFEKQRKELIESTQKKLQEEWEFKFKDSKNELEEAKVRNKALQEQQLELNKLVRELREQNDKVALEAQKKMHEEMEKERENILKTVQEKVGLEKMELQKQLDDTKKALEDAQRKAAQKSQQLQGEVLELELENLLRQSFPHDEIISVSKGVSGADIKHIVRSPRGIVCGTILWELKRTKDWSDKWIPKLKEDMRQEKADIPVIVSIDLPKEADGGFGQIDGVVICGHGLAIPIAGLLRKNLLDVGYQKAVSANKGEKAEYIHTYVTGREFQQHIENIAEAYRELSLQIIREKTAFQKIWKTREMQAQRIILSAASIYGSMQGIVGGSMPQVKGLELSQLEDGDEQLTLTDD